MELSNLLNTFRDPGLTVITVLITIYLTRDYVKKSEFKEHVETTKKEFGQIHDKFVSKEKLNDVMKPMGESLHRMQEDIGEIKKFLLEVVKK